MLRLSGCESLLFIAALATFIGVLLLAALAMVSQELGTKSKSRIFKLVSPVKPYVKLGLRKACF